MGDVIEFLPECDTLYARLCNECDNHHFEWFTSKEDERFHVLACPNCEEVYIMKGREMLDDEEEFPWVS